VPYRHLPIQSRADVAEIRALSPGVAARYEQHMANGKNGSVMSQNPSTADWAASRGEKWLAQLSGMEASLRPIDEPLIRALQLDAPLRIAEIGCGGGGTALELLSRAPAGSVVHGFDIAPGLIELARSRTPPEAHNLTFEVADAATATPATTFDRLVSRFGIMFFEQPDAAFTHLARWLVPGGRFAFAVWASPAQNPWFSNARDVVAGIVEMPPPDPDAPGPFRYAEAGKLLALLERAGLGELRVEDWVGTLPIGGGLPPAGAAHFALAAISSFGELLAKAGAGALDEAHRALTARYSQHQEDGVVRMGTRVHIVTGARPA
jgi:SAM-dependent methyltransferase